MASKGNFPISQMPLLPIRAAATQTQVSGTPGVANRTITTPQDDLPFTVGALSVNLSLSMMSPGNILSALENAGIDASLDRFGYLTVPSAPSGNATMLTALGF